MAKTSLTIVGKEGIFPIVVDPAQRIKELVRQGQYEGTNPNINDRNFPSNGNGGERTEVPLRLARLLREVEKLEELHEDLGRRELRAATLSELLRFGIKFRSRPRQSREPIFALSAVWSTGDGDLIAYLGRTGSGRRLDLFWSMFGLIKGTRLLVAPKG